MKEQKFFRSLISSYRQREKHTYKAKSTALERVETLLKAVESVEPRRELTRLCR
jgi:hypothetical protein